MALLGIHALATPPPTAPPACPNGAITTTNATWGSACFSLTAQRASSLRQCVEWCGEQGMTPACIGSTEENAFAAGLVPADDWAYIGHYQSKANGNAAQDQCVEGKATGFVKEADIGSAPHGLPSECELLNGRGVWQRTPCIGPKPLLFTFRCLCAGPAGSSASFERDLGLLEDAVETETREQQLRAAVVYAVAALLTVLPTVIFLSRRRMPRGATAAVASVRRLSRSSQAAIRRLTRLGSSIHRRSQSPPRLTARDSSAVVDDCARTLRKARRTAEERRLRVSGLMAQIGWTFSLFGWAPLVMFFSGRPIDAVIGAYTFWQLLVPSGLCILLLAMLPTDAFYIRTACVVLFIAFLWMGLLVVLLTLTGALTLLPGIPMMVLFFAAAGGMGRAVPCTGPRAMQPRLALRWMWFVARVVCLAVCASTIGGTLASFAANRSAIRDPYPWGRAVYGAGAGILSFIMSPHNRGRLHRRLGRLGGRGSEEEAAAAISALVAGADPDQALADAVQSFRCLRASLLRKEDLARTALGVSASAAELAAKTEPAGMGEVTCFLSHSWRDEQEAPGAKYETFARWARQHEERTGVEPTMWLVRPYSHPCPYSPPQA